MSISDSRGRSRDKAAAAALLLLVCAGCASPGKVQQAGTLPSIALLLPTEPGSTASTITLDAAIKNAAAALETSLDAGTKIALVNFTSPSAALSDYILDELSTLLVAGKKVTVVERKELDLLRGELDFQYSGEVSDESMQSIGHMLGAQTIVSGSLVKIGSDYKFRVNAMNVATSVREISLSENVKNDSVIMSLLVASPHDSKSTSVATGSASTGGAGTDSAATVSAATGGTGTDSDIKMFQDGKEIKPVSVEREFGGVMPSYIVQNKPFTIALPDTGSVSLSASTRGFFSNVIDDVFMIGWDEKEGYPYLAEAVSCFRAGAELEGHNSFYDNRLYAAYKFDAYQWYESGEKILINEIAARDELSRKALEGGQDNIYVVLWINKNKNRYVEEDEIVPFEIQIRGKGSALK